MESAQAFCLQTGRKLLQDHLFWNCLNKSEVAEGGTIWGEDGPVCWPPNFPGKLLGWAGMPNALKTWKIALLGKVENIIKAVS